MKTPTKKRAIKPLKAYDRIVFGCWKCGEDYLGKGPHKCKKGKK